MAYRDQLKLFTDAGIEAGVQELEYYLDPKNSAENHFGSKAERAKIVADFRETCRQYNIAIQSRNDVRAEQREALAETPLPHLGLPVELRGSKEANRLLSNAIIEAERKRGWAPDGSFKSWLIGVAKDMFAIIGSMTIVPMLFSRWRDFVASRESAPYRERILRTEALAQQTQDLKRINQKLAENWVKEAYKYEPEEAVRGNAHNEKLYDPHGLFAAFANYDRPQIVDAVKTQLRLAAKTDQLETKEKRAKDLKVALDDKAADDLRDKDFIEDKYLSELAEGIVDGLEYALGDALIDQLKGREDSKATVSANAFVNTTDMQVEMMCGRTWGAVSKMLHSDLRSPERKYNFDQFLNSQKKSLGTIEADIEAAKQGPIPAGQIDSLSGPLDLPRDGERLKHLDYAMKFARTEFDAAEDAAGFVTLILGSAKVEPTLLWLDNVLNADAIGGWLMSGDTIEKCEADFKEHMAAITASKENLDRNAHRITDDIHGDLDDMIWNLETRAACQRDLRTAVIELDTKMREATSSEDVTKLAKLADEFSEEVKELTSRMGLAAGLSDPFDVDDVIKANKAQGQETIARLKDTSQLIKAHIAANDKAKNTIAKIENGDVTLDAGLRDIDDVYKVFSEVNTSHQDRWRDYEGIGNKFPDTAAEITSAHAQALMAALQIPSDKGPLSEEAQSKVEFLRNAGVLNDHFVEAFRQSLLQGSGGNNTLSANDLAASIDKLGADEQGKAYAPEFAKLVYPGDADQRLRLTVDLLRQAGASTDEINAIRREHYGEIAGRLLQSTANDGALDKAFATLGKHPKNLQERLDTIEFLFKKYPNIFGEQDRNIINAATTNLRHLMFDPNTPLNETEITQAVRLAQLLVEINAQSTLDTETVSEIRIANEQNRGQELRTKIAGRFGLDGLDNTDAVKNSADKIISAANNQDGLQDVMAQSANIRGLIQTQQESAKLLEGAVLRPLKDFAKLIDLDATADDARDIMESKAFQQKARVLENLNRLLASDDAVRRNQLNGDTDSAIYEANLMALTTLSHKLRQFDPSTMKAGGGLTNRLAMWWNDETPQDVVENLKAKGSQDVADRFVSVWKHLVTLNALNASNDQLSEELFQLTRQRNALMSDVQRHRSNQFAMMAALDAFEKAGGSAKDFTFTDKNVGRIKETLAAWGQESAWTTLKETYGLDEGRSIDDVIDRWTADCNSLPVDIQRKTDDLKTALAGFEMLIKTLADSDEAMANTHLASDKLPSLEEQEAEADEWDKVLPIARTRTKAVLKNLMTTSQDWSAHPQWIGGPTRDALLNSRFEKFNTDFINTLKEKFPNDVKVGTLIKLLHQAADLDDDIRTATALQLDGVTLRNKTVQELTDKALALRDAAIKAHPSLGVSQEIDSEKPLAGKDLVDVLTYHIAGDISDYFERQVLRFNPDGAPVDSDISDAEETPPPVPDAAVASDAAETSPPVQNTAVISGTEETSASHPVTQNDTQESIGYVGKIKSYFANKIAARMADDVERGTGANADLAAFDGGTMV
ncbi:MAG: hypothetical protein AAGC95_01370 [Pseudomonadota bacterium]